MRKEEYMKVRKKFTYQIGILKSYLKNKRDEIKEEPLKEIQFQLESLIESRSNFVKEYKQREIEFVLSTSKLFQSEVSSGILTKKLQVATRDIKGLFDFTIPIPKKRKSKMKSLPDRKKSRNYFY